MLRSSALALTASLVVASSLAMAQSSPSKPDLARAQTINSQRCSACHGSDGNSVIATNPVIAGQGYEYLVKQLRNYKASKDKEGGRPNPIMTAQVADLSDEDLQALATLFAGQKAKGGVARNKEFVALGRSIYRAGISDRGVAACAGCHAPNGAGIPAVFPRLAGQHAEYTEAQMKQWRTGERANDSNAMMRSIAGRMNDREIQAVSDYVAGLR